MLGISYVWSKCSCNNGRNHSWYSCDSVGDSIQNTRISVRNKTKLLMVCNDLSIIYFTPEISAMKHAVAYMLNKFIFIAQYFQSATSPFHVQVRTIIKHSSVDTKSLYDHNFFDWQKKPIEWSPVIYLGAKSTWLTTYPARQSPVNITASDSSATAMSRWSHDVYPTATSRAPAPINATQNQEKKQTQLSNTI